MGTSKAHFGFLTVWDAIFSYLTTNFIPFSEQHCFMTFSKCFIWITKQIKWIKSSSPDTLLQDTIDCFHFIEMTKLARIEKWNKQIKQQDSKESNVQVLENFYIYNHFKSYFQKSLDYFNFRQKSVWNIVVQNSVNKQINYLQYNPILLIYNSSKTIGF